MQTGEALIPFRMARDKVAVATRFRSTWLNVSLESLKARGYFERYLARLPKQHHEAVLSAIAGVWLPVEVAVAHYEAIDSLGMSVPDILRMGEEVPLRVNASFVKLARAAGVTPWTAAVQLGRLWDRCWVGGAIGVFRLGPKEGRIELLGFPCAHIPYARIGLRGTYTAAVQLFSTKAYVREIPALCKGTSLGYQISWV